ncbi:MAG: type II toxin-antitoxin system HicB family antitoxin [Bacteroidales bacterium]|nr:type II toxin-antitoxin system HicB family antitoxin [Bacteroidales bacterium]
MNTLTYNGYTGSVEFSEEDNVFFGKLEGINALVNYEGESVTELKNAFKEAVTDYLEFCKAEGITPEKPYSGKLDITVTPEIHNTIARLAHKNGISINAFVNSAIEKQIGVFA